MRIFTGSRLLASLCLAVTAGAFSGKSFADSYTIYQVSSKNSGNVDNIGLTDSGSLTTLIFGGSPSSPTYSTFTPPSTTTTSPTLPALTFDNGSACTPTVSGVTGVSQGKCNNGVAVFSAFSGASVFSNLYLLEAGMPLQLLYTGPVDNVLLDANGDIAFVGLNGTDKDTNFLYYDDTSRAAVTPEPSSLILLLTGGLGTAALWRRRLRQA
jgi:hypothetical protein